MREIDFSQAKQEGKGFVFPGQFEITAIGNASADLVARVPAILAGIGVHVLHETLKHKHSREGHFLSVSVSFYCGTREQYDLAHATLRADPDIRYTL